MLLRFICCHINTVPVIEINMLIYLTYALYTTQLQLPQIHKYNNVVHKLITQPLPPCALMGDLNIYLCQRTDKPGELHRKDVVAI